jgi:hypothetical protein
MKTRLLVLGWMLVVAGAAVLFQRYESMPSLVPGYRMAFHEATWLPKSFLSVGRIAAMGAGQVGAATAMAHATRASDRWRRLWQWCAVTAGAKTFIECIGFAARDPRVDAATFVATALIAVGAVVAALIAWRRLGAPPPVTSRARVAVTVSLLLWGGLAVLPRLMAS